MLIHPIFFQIIYLYIVLKLFWKFIFRLELERKLKECLKRLKSGQYISDTVSLSSLNIWYTVIMFISRRAYLWLKNIYGSQHTLWLTNYIIMNALLLWKNSILVLLCSSCIMLFIIICLNYSELFCFRKDIC